MIRYDGGLKEYPYENARKIFPQLQECVYKVLVELSPEQLQFHMGAIQDHCTYNAGAIDTGTFEVIGTVMGQLLERENVIMTRDDLMVSHAAFNALIYLKLAMDQGLIVPAIEDAGIEYYYTVGTPTNDVIVARPMLLFRQNK